MKPALILPVALFCLSSCKKEEVVSLKKDTSAQSAGQTRQRQMIQADITRVTTELDEAQQANLDLARAIPVGGKPGPDVEARANQVQRRLDEAGMKLIALNRELNGQPSLDEPALRALLNEQHKAAAAAIHQQSEDKIRQSQANLQGFLEVNKKISELQQTNLNLAKENVKLAKAGADPEELARNEARIEENQQTIIRLKAGQDRKMSGAPDAETVKELMSQIPDSIERRQGKIASLERMITSEQDARTKLTTLTERLESIGNSPEGAAKGRQSIDEITRHIEELEQRKRDEQKALVELQSKSAETPSSH